MSLLNKNHHIYTYSFRNHIQLQTIHHNQLKTPTETTITCVYFIEQRAGVSEAPVVQHHFSRALLRCGHSLQSSSTSKPRENTRTSGCDVCHLQYHVLVYIEAMETILWWTMYNIEMECAFFNTLAKAMKYTHHIWKQKWRHLIRNSYVFILTILKMTL